MFGRFSKCFRKLLPFSLALGPCLFNPIISLSTNNSYQKTLSRKIKIIDDISQYVEGDSNPNRALLICELHGEEFIDSQLLKLAEDFSLIADGNIGTDFEFLFVKGQQSKDRQLENYLIIYSNRGEKVIHLDPYINHNRNQPQLKAQNKLLFKRIVEIVNGHRDLSLSNIGEELSKIEKTNKYAAIAVIPDPLNQNETEKKLSNFLKSNDIKSKDCSKYVVKDKQSRQILGLNGKQPGIYLLAAINSNINPEFIEHSAPFKIGEKQFVTVPVNGNLNEVFVFPPIQPSLPPEKIVLNVYINKNQNTAQIQEKITKQLSKLQYRHFYKAMYYSGQVDVASLTLQMSEYSKIALKAYDPQSPLEPSRVKEILLNTYEWNYKINNTEQINSEEIQKWIRSSTGEYKMNNQVYRSEKIGTTGWSYPLTGSEYKSKRDEPNDKVIYHYSQNCHGCKKFGGKYQEFARNRRKYPGLKFYRINNDYNKVEGVRNFNSTPVFVYYKQNCLTPFVYRMPIFTDELFQDFITITGSVKLIDSTPFWKMIANRAESQSQVKELLQKIE